MSRRTPWLLHEFVFGGFLATMVARLAVAVGPRAPLTGAWAGLLGLALALIAWTERSPTTARWRIRLLYYAVAMNVAFQLMRISVPQINGWRADPLLRTIDQALVGETPSLLLDAWVTPWLTDLMVFCYFLFLPYLFFSLIWYLWRPVALAQRFWVGLFTIYGIGFLGYSLVPASGPWVAMAPEFHHAIEGNRLSAGLLAIIARGTNGVDVFPSLHVAVSTYCLLSDRRHARWRFRLYLVPCVILWISTVYLRYHYLIDLIGGFSLAALALVVSARFVPRPNPEESP